MDLDAWRGDITALLRAVPAAYNDWLVEWCEADPVRPVPMMMLPLLGHRCLGGGGAPPTR